MKNYLNSVGVDISKSFFDAVLFLSGEHEKFTNEKKGFIHFEKWLKKHGSNSNNVLVCFENTGYFSTNLAIYLTEKHYDYVQEHPLQIKRSIGLRRGKSDKADATDIARYAWLNRENLRLSKAPSKTLLTLQQTKTARDLLVKQAVAIKNQLKGLEVVGDRQIYGIACKSLNRVLSTIKKQILKLEGEIREKINQDEELSAKFKLCRSVTGVGLILALEMIIHTQNFTGFSEWRKFAAYSGTVPYPYQSGTSIKGRARIHPSSNQRMKSLLTMAAIAAIRVDPELRQYYKRRVEEGKPKMSVINMIRNKMLARIFSTVQRGTPFVTMSKFAA
jgi:transposase